jgi:hypothetical protein
VVYKKIKRGCLLGYPRFFILTEGMQKQKNLVAKFVRTFVLVYNKRKQGGDSNDKGMSKLWGAH